jgi:hypothetical protein
MKKVNLKYGLIALAGLGISANVSAADFGCSDLTFSPEAYEAYEFVDQACLDVVDRDGGTYVKMTASIVAQTPNGTRIRYRHSDGKLGPNHLSKAPGDFETMISGRAVKLNNLAVRQEMNVYLSPNYWSLPVVEVAGAAPAVVAAAPPPPPPAPEPEPEPEPEVLPTTAGPLPWLVLFGSMFLLLGGALRLSRKQ